MSSDINHRNSFYWPTHQERAHTHTHTHKMQFTATHLHQNCLYLYPGVPKYQAQSRRDDSNFTVALSMYGDLVWNLVHITFWLRVFWGGSWIFG